MVVSAPGKFSPKPTEIHVAKTFAGFSITIIVIEQYLSARSAFKAFRLRIALAAHARERFADVYGLTSA